MNGVRLLAGFIAALIVAAGAALPARQSESPQPWAAGQCYRVSVLDGDQQHVIRVLEAPRGDWVRVQGDPASPRVPGADARTPVWLNAALVFTLQQVECTRGL